MDEQIDDGGPAFPLPPTPDPRSGNAHGVVTWESGFGGMTLRDWFAGQVMVGIMAYGHSESTEESAHNAYTIADAMLEARKGGT